MSKKEFLDILKGDRIFHIRKNTMVGTFFLTTSKKTGHINSYIYVRKNSWTIWGTLHNKHENFTNIQLELYLTKMVRNDPDLGIVDMSQCLEWDDIK